MVRQILAEYQNPTSLETEILEESIPGSNERQKSLYMKGIFIQGNVKNANQRVYPAEEIRRAVNSITKLIKEEIPIFGELDHPADLKINLERVSHVVTEMWMDGFNGIGKLKVLDTPMGRIVKTILESKVNLGVSSRGSGNVNEGTGQVSDFEIITVDVVAQPSAPDAWPVPIYESMINMKHGYKGIEIARDAYNDAKTQKYLKNFVTDFIKDLRIK